MVQLTGIRFGLHQVEATGEQMTRVVMELDGAAKFEVEQLKDPLRIYFDFKNTRLALDKKELVINDSIVLAIRAGQFKSNVTRVVFNITKVVPYKTFALAPAKKGFPYRVVLDLIREPKVQPLPQDLKGKIIVLDPGHGGEDPGATGFSGTQEKEITLDLVRRSQQLVANRGAKVIHTRSGDTFITLEDRVSLANANKAHLFVSIHNNSAITRRPRGLETYYYPKSQAGRIVAGKIQEALVAKLGLPDRGIKTANLYVLHHSKMPACLVEIGFISNLQEEEFLLNPANRQKAAEAITTGIANYFSR